MWDTLVVTPLVKVLVFLTDAFQSLGIPYPFGFAIIALTLLLKIITYPLSLQQIRSAKAMQSLKPKLDELQKKYGKDRERLAQEQMKLYGEAGVNPLGGCLPLLIQLPILWGLFSALRHPELEAITNASFFFIHDLHCPSCSAWPPGTGWLWPLPPAVGWNIAAGYLALPILLIATQILLQRFTAAAAPSGDDAQMRTMNTKTTVFALLFGYYSLIFPASLSLYYIVFNLLTIAQQYIASRSALGQPKWHTAQVKEGTEAASVGGPRVNVDAISPDGADDAEEAVTKVSRPARRSRRRRKK
jgi:YidC/Oxa1 family membrane protein insertase